MMYFIGWSLSFLIARLYLGIKVYGRSNIPSAGAFIFASNHESNCDPFLLGISIYRPIEYLAKEELFRHPFSRWIFTSFHAHPVRRGNGDLHALKETLKMLWEGKPFLIFPEGTRSKDGTLQPGKPGIGLIVYKSGVPVVPAYINGSYEAMPGDEGKLNHHPVRVTIGEPIYFDDLRHKPNTRELYQEISDRIMCRIALLKEEDGLREKAKN